jgi:3-methyl-2-oxobutanoate hydroxymethyltransferase
MKSITEFGKMKLKKEKISVITCYDYWSAKIIDNSNIDAVLVGDSSAMVIHGFETTINATTEMMCYHISSVKRGITNKLIIADLPFLAHRKGTAEFYNSVDQLMKSGANAVKIEGASGNLELIEELVQSGIPVMGHLGLTPQSIYQLGGYKVQGKNEKSSEKIFDDSLLLQNAGCFAIVLEMVPSVLAKKITEELTIPTIGIGAGPDTDGQVLVLHDLLGLNKDFHPKFVRQYLNGYEEILAALNNYTKDIKHNNFPSKEESN